MADTRKDTGPATPTFSQDKGEAGTSQDGSAVCNQPTTKQGQTRGSRQRRRAIAALHSSVRDLAEAALRAINRANRLVDEAERLRTTCGAQRSDNPPSPMGSDGSYGVTIDDDLDRLRASTDALASAARDVCEIIQLGG